jgi:hypothetical protein
MRIVLKQEKRLYVIEKPILNSLSKDAKEIRNEYQCHVDDDEHAAYVMLIIMSFEFKKQHENMDVHTTIMHLKEFFDETSKTERYETSNELFRYKMIKGSSMNTHVLKMIGYIKILGQLDFFMDHELNVDLVL